MLSDSTLSPGDRTRYTIHTNVKMAGKNIKTSPNRTKHEENYNEYYTCV